jgi:hypothetical protein
MSERAKRCETCLFWELLGEVHVEDGECHRFPPVLAPQPQQQVQGCWDGVWPNTQSFEWCGEWKVLEDAGKHIDLSKNSSIEIDVPSDAVRIPILRNGIRVDQDKST